MAANGAELKSRPYQAELEEIALRKNTIIHLPTGSGKTFIAICLIKKFKEALQPPWGQGGKRTFFLVNTVPLVNQQKKCISNLCFVSGVGGYSSEDNVDYWDKAKWDAELEKNQVVVMTSQILCDMLTHCYIRIEDINLLILDECHHAVDDHPMRMVMKHFENCPPSKQPRVLGLTATLLNANVALSKVQETLRDLETTLHATIATVNELGKVLPYSTNPNELVIGYIPGTLSPAAGEAILRLTKLQELVMSVQLPHVSVKHEIQLKRWQQDITTDPKKIVKAVKNMIVSMVTCIQEMGAYGGAISILAYIVLLERLKRKSSTVEEGLLYTFTISHSTEARLILLKSMENDTGYTKILKHSSDKVLKLLNILKEYNPAVMDSAGVLLKVNKARKPISAIIFTQQRFTAKVIFNLLKDVKKENPKEFDFLKHDFIVGFNVNPMKCTREQHYLKKSSHKALLKFGNSELNCLISTSVIEEGVDIPQCLLVLRYDPPLEYRSYIQSKGRARSKESSYVLLINKAEERKFMNNYATFKQTEQYIQRLLVSNTDDREAPTQEDIQEGLYEEDDIPPYVTSSGARLSSVSAISLLNRYCAMLPHDQFTVITPMWIQEKVNEKGQECQRMVTILLPLACPVKDPIQGMSLGTLKLAKRSAALNACIRLHQEGELDPITLLPHQYACVNFDNIEVKDCFPNWPWDQRQTEDEEGVLPKAGTKRRMRKHQIEFPSCLKAVPNARTFYLHIIKLTPAFDKPKESRDAVLYDFLNWDNGFGFLTQKPLPKLCEFPSFTTVGEVTTSIEVNYAVINLNSALFDLVKRFHFFLFDQVLAVAKKFLVFEGLVNCMYVVPIQAHNGYDIDWGIMQTHTEIQPVEIIPDEIRRNLQVTVEDYKLSVVSPWYRDTLLPERYIVSNVLEYMTPKSHFDDMSYETFADYYRAKYNLTVLGSMDQPLLEVRNISSRMNCLLPRAATINTFTDKQQKLVSASQGDYKPRAFTEIFIPEYCVKFHFPGVLWFKAGLLPSIVHRLHMLLGALELMSKISSETGYGCVDLPKNEVWLPIKVNMNVAIKSLLSQVEEPAPINTIDRIHNPAAENTARRPIIATMRENLYQLQMKKMHMEYPWDEKLEPIDIERNLSTVTVMDIELYDEFVSAPMVENNKNVRSPQQTVPHSAAITAPPLKYMDKIQILSKRPVGRGPELRDVVCALTTIKSSDVFNLERAETLGDSFLKFLATLYLFHKFPKLNEGQLTNIKCRLISNRNLYYAGEKFNLGGRMKIEQFSPRKDFLVPGFFAPKRVQDFIEDKKIRPTFLISMQVSPEEALSGELSDESWQSLLTRYTDFDGAAENEPDGGAQNAMQYYLHAQAVSDKSVADCVEALVGTYLLSGGILGAIKVLEWMKVMPPQDNVASYLHKPIPTVLSENKATVKEVEYLLNNYKPDVEKILNYKFKDSSLLLQAMSHSSYIRNRLTSSYERLEFLGDAVLDFLITAHIFENCGDLKPGEMTDLRSSLVNNVTFAAYVVKLELHKFLCAELNPSLDKVIMTFVEHQERRSHEIVEDVLYLIDEEECQVAEYIEVPKVLSDIFESLVGAIYLDSGGDLQKVWSVVYRIMCKEIHNFSARIPQQPVKVFYEMIHACPSFGEAKVINPDIPKIMISATFTKNDGLHTVYGVGGNKSQAKRAAAKLALKVLALN